MYFNAPQRPNITNETLLLHVMIVVDARAIAISTALSKLFESVIAK